MIKNTHNLERTTIAFGYSLFILLLIAVTVTTIIPLGTIYFAPGVRQSNVLFLLVSLVAGAVLPPLISYFIGDKATHSRSKINHHFNGILFGIVAYWLWTFFSFIGMDLIAAIRSELAEPLASIAINWPVFASVAIIAIVAYGFERHQKTKKTLLEYAPYRMLLLTSVALTLIYTFAYQYFHMSTSFLESNWYSIAPVTAVIVSYVLLRRYKPAFLRLTTAIIVMSIGQIAISTSAQLLATISQNFIWPVLVGVATLIAYLLLIIRNK